MGTWTACSQRRSRSATATSTAAVTCGTCCRGVKNVWQPYLAESVDEVVWQKSISAHTRRRVLYVTNIKNKLTDLCGNWLLRNDSINSLSETKPLSWSMHGSSRVLPGSCLEPLGRFLSTFGKKCPRFRKNQRVTDSRRSLRGSTDLISTKVLIKCFLLLLIKSQLMFYYY